MRAGVMNYHWLSIASCEQWVSGTDYIFLARPKLWSHGPIASYKTLRFFVPTEGRSLHMPRSELSPKVVLVEAPT